MRLILVLIFIGTLQLLTAQNSLSPEQAAWLYRIVRKTPVLERNWGHFFTFNEDAFIKVVYGQYETDYNAILHYQVQHPDSLQIDYQNIQKTSPGLISEAAIKLTLWELNEALKNCIYRPEQCPDAIYNFFTPSLRKLLPGKLKTKKQQAVLHCIMHPSLPLSKKIELLTNDYKLDAIAQKKLLNKWRQLVTSYALANSRRYFGLLAGNQSFDNITFLAAGEGSGTAGLLYETERHPEDSTKSWYGKGIGLFTYEVKTGKTGLHPLSHSSDQITLPAGKASALHVSLWGLNSSFKPMIIITHNSKTYHLLADFASRELSPDPDKGNGISHIDRIKQYRDKKIEPLLRDLRKEGSLQDILQKEMAIKTEIDTNLARLSAEIDTLQKEASPNLAAIEHRKKLIDTHLTNLTRKEKRITELERKLSAEYSKLSNAEKKLAAMQELLGPDPQSWKTEEEQYVFEDGVRFDLRTQDLIFPASSEDIQLDVRLLSAGYTLEGKQKDEVQMYVSLTDAPADKKQLAATTTLNPIRYQHTFYFYPDEFQTFTAIPDTLKQLLATTIEQGLQVQTSIAPLPDSLLNNDALTISSYKNREQEFRQPISLAGQNRKVLLNLKQQGDTLYMTALGSTDAVPTRLSMLPLNIRKQLKATHTSATNNSYLSALRALSVITLIQPKIPSDFKSQYNINRETLNLLRSYLNQNNPKTNQRD